MSFHGLHVVARFNPVSLATELNLLDYGASAEQPKHLLKRIFGSNAAGTPRQMFFRAYIGAVFSRFT